MDRLIDVIEATGNPSVVGLDPTVALLPPALTQEADHLPESEREAYLAKAYMRFNDAVITAVSGIVPAVKLQIAMYEALGIPGLQAFVDTAAAAQRAGLYVIGDIKRGDIGSTATAYASHLTSKSWHEDAVTVNPYLGTDGVMPFVTAAEQTDKDLFVLVRTSNPSSTEIQALETSDGTVADRVGHLVETWGESSRGQYGYSRVGAVVGATQPQVGARLRSAMPHTFFLVPGYGAQGGTARDLTGFFDRGGRGAIVNSSRGIIGAWKNDPRAQKITDADSALSLVGEAAAAAARSMATDIHSALKGAQ